MSKWLTAGELRASIKDVPDDEAVQLACEYRDVCDKYVFLRIDGLEATENGTLKLIVSLVHSDEIVDEDDELDDGPEMYLYEDLETEEDDDDED